LNNEINLIRCHREEDDTRMHTTYVTSVWLSYSRSEISHFAFRPLTYVSARSD